MNVEVLGIERLWSEITWRAVLNVTDQFYDEFMTQVEMVGLG